MYTTTPLPPHPLSPLTLSPPESFNTPHNLNGNLLEFQSNKIMENKNVQIMKKKAIKKLQASK